MATHQNMAVEPQYTDEVQVVFKPVDKNSARGFLVRHILLTKNNTSIHIGRSTNRDAKLTEKPNNGWFDYPVMSRNHAKIFFSPSNNSISITDTGSLHGTYVNNNYIARHEAQVLNSGDIVKFGALIQKGVTIFQPCEMRIELKRGSSNPDKRPMIFKVPDFSDEEDSTSDVDEILDSTVAIMQRVGGTATSCPNQNAAIVEIDLTTDEPSVAKAADVSAKRAPSEQITSKNDEPARETSRSNWTPRINDNRADANGSHAGFFYPCSSHFAAEAGGDQSSDERVLDPWRHLVSLHRLTNSNRSQCASAYSQPSSLTKQTIDLNNPEMLREEACSVTKHADPSPAFPSQKSCSQAQKTTEMDEWTGGAKPDAVATDTLFRPCLPKHDILEPAQSDQSTSLSAKAEFFAAREHNRRVHDNRHVSSEAATQAKSSNVAQNDEGGSSSLSIRNSISNVDGHSKSWTCTSTAALLASGETFLQTSPAVDETPTHTSNLDGLLADSLAFADEIINESLGQMDDGAAVFAVEETRLSDEDETESPDTRCNHTRKRKSEEISILLPKEVETVSNQTQVESSRPVDIMETSPMPQSHGPQIIYMDSPACSERPPKRLRRAAEILGYAALGGIAVMSALIATAPAL